jgi:hypothetical protein
MKYGIIILILCYLFVSGCIPDKKKEKQAEHKKNEIEATVEHAPAPQVAVAAKHTEQIEPHPAEKTVEAQPVQSSVQENRIGEQPQETVAAEEPAQQEDQVVIIEEKQEQPQEAVTEKVTENTQTANQPCELQKRYPSAPLQVTTQPDARGQEIAAAIEKLVVATNNMVYMTRQMVTATEEMLRATRGVAVEVVESGKEIVQNETAQQSAAAETGVKEAMNNMVQATKEVVEATRNALSTTTKEQQQ